MTTLSPHELFGSIFAEKAKVETRKDGRCSVESIIHEKCRGERRCSGEEAVVPFRASCVARDQRESGRQEALDTMGERSASWGSQDDSAVF